MIFWSFAFADEDRNLPGTSKMAEKLGSGRRRRKCFHACDWKHSPVSHWSVKYLHSFWVGQSSLLQAAIYCDIWTCDFVLYFLDKVQISAQELSRLCRADLCCQKEEMGSDTKHQGIFPLLKSMLISVMIQLGKYTACNKSVAYLLSLH